MGITLKVCKENHQAEYDETTKKCYAKKIYSFDLGRVIDRTQEPKKFAFDIDFRKPDASNPLARSWTYGGSNRTLEKAKSDAIKISDTTGAQIRVVDNKTGEILFW